jgi:hypothetical protein
VKIAVLIAALLLSGCTPVGIVVGTLGVAVGAGWYVGYQQGKGEVDQPAK